MTDLACIAAKTLMLMSAREETAAQTNTEIDDDKVFHAVSRSIDLFADSRCVGIVA
jgi:hypothetical protein